MDWKLPRHGPFLAAKLGEQVTVYRAVRLAKIRACPQIELRKCAAPCARQPMGESQLRLKTRGWPEVTTALKNMVEAAGRLRSRVLKPAHP
ncbi:MAG: hypothetical protein Q7S40_09780 [Opitutaceae bacterium]|nr:hypothetical protein [Opitutaceae bacterium]